jgi:CheY-like chemotaxis protein
MIAVSPRLLVVDDYRDAADSLAMLLELHDYEVAVAYDGESALKIAAAWLPDVMLIDIAMPGMDGLCLARLIREQPSLRDASLIALTGHTGRNLKELALAAGFDHFRLKPFPADELLALIQAAPVRR